MSSTLRADLRPFPKDGAAGHTLKPNRCVLSGIESFTAGSALMEDWLTATDVDGLEGIFYPGGETYFPIPLTTIRIRNELSVIDALHTHGSSPY